MAGFRAALPDATIYVYDNNSNDRTAEVAAAAGAIVRTERMQGKGHVVRRMFADVEADIYVMADGDATYDASAAPALVAKLIDEQLDMVVGTRVHEASGRLSPRPRARQPHDDRPARAAVRPNFHRHLLGLPRFLATLRQELPGALPRVRDRDRDQRPRAGAAMPVGEVETAYGARPEGSESKLSTYRDGWRILRTILHLYRIERPVLFYGFYRAAARPRRIWSRSRSRSPTSKPASSRASRPRSSPPA